MSEQKLPMAREAGRTVGASAPPRQVEASSIRRLVATLAVAGCASQGLAHRRRSHQWADPRILEAWRAAGPLGGGDRMCSRAAGVGTETLCPVIDGASDHRAARRRGHAFDLDRVYLGYDASAATPVGIAMVGAGEPGFQDVISLIFGYDPVEGRVLGMKVLDNKETPGLGDKIVKDSRVRERVRRRRFTALIGVKAGSRHGRPDAEVDMITGATISSRAR